tara:strand:+ start:3197 stop:3835 length:639 start_codon:yes stop_codon:yes gene_type:complete
MFRKSKKKAASNSQAETDGGGRKPQPTGVPSIISVDLILKGDLESIGDIQIDGQVYGDVKSRSLTVGENAKVVGSIVADRVRVCGRVEGQIQAKNVVLTVTSKVVGDVVHEALEIESGAFIHGLCRRKEVESEQQLADSAATIATKTATEKLTEKLTETPSENPGKNPVENSAGNSRELLVAGKGQDKSAAKRIDRLARVENPAEKKSAVGD